MKRVNSSVKSKPRIEIDLVESSSESLNELEKEINGFLSAMNVPPISKVLPFWRFNDFTNNFIGSN